MSDESSSASDALTTEVLVVVSNSSSISNNNNDTSAAVSAYQCEYHVRSGTIRNDTGHTVNSYYDLLYPCLMDVQDIVLRVEAAVLTQMATDVSIWPDGSVCTVPKELWIIGVSSSPSDSLVPSVPCQQLKPSSSSSSLEQQQCCSVVHAPMTLWWAGRNTVEADTLGLFDTAFQNHAQFTTPSLPANVTLQYIGAYMESGPEPNLPEPTRAPSIPQEDSRDDPSAAVNNTDSSSPPNSQLSPASTFTSTGIGIIAGMGALAALATVTCILLYRRRRRRLQQQQQSLSNNLHPNHSRYRRHSRKGNKSDLFSPEQPHPRPYQGGNDDEPHYSTNSSNSVSANNTSNNDHREVQGTRSTSTTGDEGESSQNNHPPLQVDVQQIPSGSGTGWSFDEENHNPHHSSSASLHHYNPYDDSENNNIQAMMDQEIHYYDDYPSPHYSNCADDMMSHATMNSNNDSTPQHAYTFDLSSNMKLDVMRTYSGLSTTGGGPPYPLTLMGNNNNNNETSDSEVDSWAQTDGTVGSLDDYRLEEITAEI